MDANERPVLRESLRGKWKVVGSEIEESDHLADFYHFSDDELWWEFHFKDGQKSIHRFKYEIKEGVIRFRSRSTSHHLSLMAFHIEEFLVFRPAHEMETWMKRIGEFGERE